MKITSREILDILRRFEIANEVNIPRQIENIKITNPSPTNTMVSFVFMRHKFFVLFDEVADDKDDYIKQQIFTNRGEIPGQLLQNPRDPDRNFAMPFKGKSGYLFEVRSEKKRLDSKLAAENPSTSRSTWQKHIKAGYVCVNGNVVNSPKYEISETDSISINILDSLKFCDNKLPIIYTDDNVIVINKPAGCLTHAKGTLNEEFTVADFLRQYTTYNLDTNRPGIVHRLDRDTSGVIIGARNPETAQMLSKQFADRRTKKTYYAILDEIPKHIKANIDLPIGRNPTSPSTFRVDPSGKMAITKYEVLATRQDKSFVKLQPQTGRTHQLRVHMKYLNTPILGDKIYGREGDRLFLHASELEITIPYGERKTFYAPIPDDFTKIFGGELL